MTLGWATNSDKYQGLTFEVLKERVAAVKGGFKYYSPSVHKASFALPAYISDLLTK